MRFAWLLGLSLAWCQTFATTDEIVFNDAINDDAGDGSLIYPQRHDFQTGDLDLTKISIQPEANGYRFRVEFKNPVRDPAKITTDSGPEPMSDFARKGFYSFNVDIYIDHDHIKASGNTFTLPGRHADIVDEQAWEHAVILTPRPDHMRAQLIASLQQQFTDLPAASIQNSVNKLILFPERIQVRNKSVSFFVPAEFIGATSADTWSITAFVTGAKTTLESTWSLHDTTTNINTLALGVMQPETGLPKNTFGYKGKTLPSPIVDLLADTTEKQIRQLSASPVKLAATGNLPTQANNDARAITSWSEALGSGLVATTGNALAAGSQIKPVVTTVERLKTLQALFDQHLTTEDEYRQQRQRILNEL